MPQPIIGNCFTSTHRAPYQHQVDAAIAAICNQSNLVVATGTGSGKTESALLPVLHRLFVESEAGLLTRRVYALLVYPMNALADDQCQRLRSALAGTNIKFARLTGDTENGSPGQRSPEGPELLYRHEIAENPPHILITNYIMLERLLLLGGYKSLFKHRPACIVLDEAHVYDGTRGRDLALLLKRVAKRSNDDGEAQYIAMSATMGDPKSKIDLERVREYSKSLFGPGTNRPLEVIKPTLSTTATGPGYTTYTNLTDPATVAQLKTHLDRIALDKNVGARLHVFVSTPPGLVACSKLGCLSQLKSIKMSEPGAEACETCKSRLIEVAFCKKCGAPHFVEADRESGGNELSARYVSSKLHEVLGWVGEGKVEIAPDKTGKDHDLQVAKDTKFHGCLMCGTEDGAYGALRRASAPVNDVVAALMTSVYPNIPEGRGLRVPEITKLLETMSCSYESYLGNLRAFKSFQPAAAGPLTSSMGPLGSGLIKLVLEESPKLQTSANGVDDLLDSPVWVNTSAVSALFENRGQNPTEADSASEPHKSRKILVFSDSRQNAAYFAPYYERVYHTAHHRRLLYSILKNQDSWSYGDLCKLVAFSLESQRLEEGRSSDAPETDAKVLLLRELLAIDYSTGSLMGQGALTLDIRNSLKSAAITEIQKILEGYGHGTIDAESWLQFLVYGALRDRALTCDLTKESVSDATDHRGSSLYWYQLTESGKSDEILWLPKNIHTGSLVHNRRSEWLTRAEPGISRDACARILTTTVDALIESKIFTEVGSKDRKIGSKDRQFRLDVSALQLCAPTSPSRCPECGIWVPPAQGFTNGSPCINYKCTGQKATTGVPGGYYYEMLSGDQLPALHAAEHTAQLSTTKGKEVQDGFSSPAKAEDAVNVLSCSTTFEMGVDVGDVGVVFCRNVPPKASNYIQRAGRAGRRAGSIPITITVVRAKESRDLYFWENPGDRLVRGKIPVPPVPPTTVNLARRHVYAEIIAQHLADEGVVDLKMRCGGWYLHPKHMENSGYTENLPHIKVAHGEQDSENRDYVRFCKNFARYMGSPAHEYDSTSADNQTLANDLVEETAGSLFSLLVLKLMNSTTRDLLVDDAFARVGLSAEAEVCEKIKAGFSKWESVGSGEDLGDDPWVTDPILRGFCVFMSEYMEVRRKAGGAVRGAVGSDERRKALNEESHLNRLLKTYKERDLPNHFANCGAIPKYGFPAYQMSLTVRNLDQTKDREYDLTRDAFAAIREYFPENKLTAVNRRLRVVGVQLPPFSKTLVRRRLYRCSKCKRTKDVHDTDASGNDTCPTCHTPMKTPKKYLFPEWGMVAIEEGSAVSGFQPRTNERTETTYLLDSDISNIEMRELDDWPLFVPADPSPRPITRITLSFRNVFICLRCGCSHPAGDPGDTTSESTAFKEFCARHKDFDASRYGSSASRSKSKNRILCPRKDDKERTKYYKGRLGARDEVMGIVVRSIPDALTEAAARLLGILMAHVAAEVLQTTPEDFNVGVEASPPDGSETTDTPHKSWTILLMDAVPGGSGLTEKMIAGSPSTSLTSILEKCWGGYIAKENPAQEIENIVRSRRGEEVDPETANELVEWFRSIRIKLDKPLHP